MWAAGSPARTERVRREGPQAPVLRNTPERWEIAYCVPGLCDSLLLGERKIVGRRAGAGRADGMPVLDDAVVAALVVFLDGVDELLVFLNGFELHVQVLFEGLPVFVVAVAESFPVASSSSRRLALLMMSSRTSFIF